MVDINTIVMLVNLYINIGIDNILSLYSDGDKIYATRKRWESMGATVDENKKASIKVGIPTVGYYYTRKSDGGTVKVNDMSIAELTSALELGLVYRNRVETTQEPIDVYSYRSTGLDSNKIDIDNYRVCYRDIKEWIKGDGVYSSAEEVIRDILNELPLCKGKKRKYIEYLVVCNLKNERYTNNKIRDNMVYDIIYYTYKMYEALRKVINKPYLIDDKSELREERAVKLLGDINANEVRMAIKGGYRNV